MRTLNSFTPKSKKNAAAALAKDPAIAGTNQDGFGMSGAAATPRMSVKAQTATGNTQRTVCRSPTMPATRAVIAITAGPMNTVHQAMAERRVVAAAPKAAASLD